MSAAADADKVDVIILVGPFQFGYSKFISLASCSVEDTSCPYPLTALFLGESKL